MQSIKIREFLYILSNKKKLKNTILNVIEFLIQKDKLTSFPQVVDIVITKNCNLNCVFCKKYKSFSSNMNLDDFRKIASQVLPNARKLNICSGGEPFIHKDLIHILRAAKEFDVWVSVVSNGMLLNNYIINDLVKDELIDSIAFSVDGILPETVENIRLNVSLSTIINNIKILIDTKKKYKKRKPFIGIRYALMEKNIAELPNAISYWGKLGISYIACNYISLCNGISKNQSLYFHQKITRRIFQDAKIRKKEFPSLSLSLPPLNSNIQNNQDHKPRSCMFPWMFSMIDVDGRIFPGYNSWGAIEMGNLLNEEIEFKEAWNNQKYLNLRRTVNNDSEKKSYSYCSTCPSRIGFGSKSLHFGDEVLYENLNQEEQRFMEVNRKN